MTLEGWSSSVPAGEVPGRADGYRQGSVRPRLRPDGKWFLVVTIDVPEGTPIPVTDFLGVDLGVEEDRHGF